MIPMGIQGHDYFVQIFPHRVPFQFECGTSEFLIQKRSTCIMRLNKRLVGVILHDFTQKLLWSEDYFWKYLDVPGKCIGKKVDFFALKCWRDLTIRDAILSGKGVDFQDRCVPKGGRSIMLNFSMANLVYILQWGAAIHHFRNNICPIIFISNEFQLANKGFDEWAKVPECKMIKRL